MIFKSIDNLASQAKMYTKYLNKKMTEETSTPTRPVENVVLTTKGVQERNTQLLDGTTVEK